MRGPATAPRPHASPLPPLFSDICAPLRQSRATTSGCFGRQRPFVSSVSSGLEKLRPLARGGFDAGAHLAWGDVSICEDGRTVRVFLKRSKTDQYGRGTEVFIGSTRDELCPVRAVCSYVAIRGNSPGAFFRSSDGVPLTKGRFVELVRSSLSRAGVPTAGYSGHSFRIGAATAASQAGIPDSVIQALGRWSSSAFLRYIRTPREQLARYSDSMTGTP